MKSLDFSLYVLALSLLHFQRITPVPPLQQHNNDKAADTREQNAALSGISRASRCTKVSIQRSLGCLPPVISAD